MCSHIGQIIYGLLMFIALALTLTGALTPGWRQVEMQVNKTNIDANNPQASSDSVKEHVNMGLFSFLCVTPGENSKSTATSSDAAKEYCKDWWKNLATWEKVVITLVCLSVVIEIIALIYNFITFCCCCFRGHALKPLAPLALIAFLSLAIAIAIFGIKNKDALDKLSSAEYKDPKNAIGYSFYLECGALALLFINILIGSLSACLGGKCL